MSVPLYQVPEQQPSVWQPTSVEEAMHLKHKWGDKAVLISGGTWLRTRWENGVSPLPQHLISLAHIQALSGLAMDAGGQIHIGPSLRLADLMDSELMQMKCALLVKACAEIAAPSVRNLASIGGNVVTRTGDLITALLVMDAQVVCSNGTAEYTLPLAKWLDVPAQAISEVMTGIKVPNIDIEDAERTFEFYLKVGRREAFTPSVVTVAGRLSLAPDQTIQSLALAAGGGSAVPARFVDLETAAIGRPLSKDLLQSLHTGVSEGFQAVPDDYAGVAYRKQTAANLIVSECYKVWRKGGGANAPKS
ncbi:FAD binding domain-containing protein [Paenibacillus sp. HWE-109]|uniref:FAD binding domain-containing protein n=1 Tax=Paenibacillus sp. HWE-109 TaxID=1306526 RepID=UPI001EE0D17E|nr:FAD binding domain-containing protein [Paenibacillus sp. HWE-109]UKS26549.1 FAD binding domain-containing protein [Paenibacillus sp. HWE-109]